MLPFFACMLLVNLIVAIFQWALLQYSFETKMAGIVSDFKKDMKGYWDKKLSEFEIAVQA